MFGKHSFFFIIILNDISRTHFLPNPQTNAHIPSVAHSQVPVNDSHCGFKTGDKLIDFVNLWSRCISKNIIKLLQALGFKQKRAAVTTE